MSEGPQFYYNLATGGVEEGPQSPSSDRMGPYATRGEAEQALSIAAKRNEKWDQDDEEWED